MAFVKLQVPDQIGAVNVHVTDDDGSVVVPHQLITPHQGEQTFAVPGAGSYTLYWQPVGSKVRPHPFTVGETDVQIDIPWLSTGSFVREIHGQPPPPVSVRPKPKPRRSTSAGRTKSRAKPPKRKEISGDIWQDFSSAIQRFAERRVEASTSPQRASFRSPYLDDPDSPGAVVSTALPSLATETGRSSGPKMSVGISSDGAPVRLGGWKPYFARWPVRLSRSPGQLTFEISRDAARLDPDGHDGARVRFTIALQGKYVRRFLVPLFAGGVVVTVRDSGLTRQGTTFSVLPIEPKNRVLVQAIVANSSDDARRITSEIEMTAEHFLARLAQDDDLDPWISVVLGFIIKRYDWPEDCNWCLELARKFDWIVDTLILSAWWKSTSAGGSDYAACLEYLTKARRGGAPYFADANATMGDLLIWMASDLSDEALRNRAREELSRWRSNIVLQLRAGMSFAWRTQHGDRNNGRVSHSTDLVAYEGDFADAFGSPS